MLREWLVEDYGFHRAGVSGQQGLFKASTCWGRKRTWEKYLADIIGTVKLDKAYVRLYYVDWLVRMRSLVHQAEKAQAEPYWVTGKVFRIRPEEGRNQTHSVLQSFG